MEDTAIKRVNDDRIDELEAIMVNNMPPVECPLIHRFCKGMYLREVTVPAGTLITTKIHKQEHPFTVSKGKCLVCNDGGEWIEVAAPYTGITKPGTRRVVFVVEDCVWTTYHRYHTIKGSENELTEEERQKIVDRIESRIIEKHHNALIDRRNELWHG